MAVQKNMASVDPAEELGEESLRPIKKQSQTTGEKWFHRVRFAAGESIILALTAAIAYISSHGKDHYGKVPNYLKKIQGKLAEKLLDNKVLPFGDKGDYGKRFAGILASTTLLSQGGNVFAPFMKLLQDYKGSIVNAINSRWGKPGEVDEGQKNVKAEPKQGWFDILLGRIASWTMVFVSLVSADFIFGKEQTPGPDGKTKYKFDRFEEGFGKMVARMTGQGKNVSPTNKSYLFGKILALDIFATTAALMIWTGISKFSATRRKRKENEVAATQNPAPETDAAKKNAKEEINPAYEAPVYKEKPVFSKRGKILETGPTDHVTRMEERAAQPMMAGI